VIDAALCTVQPTGPERYGRAVHKDDMHRLLVAAGCCWGDPLSSDAVIIGLSTISRGVRLRAVGSLRRSRCSS
jgi:hypothetical protein